MQSISSVGFKKETLDVREYQALQAALVEDARPLLRMRNEVWATIMDLDWVQEVAFDKFVEMSDPELGGKYGEYPLDVIDTGARSTQEIFYIRMAQQLHYKDLAASRNLQRPLDTLGAAEIGRLIATKENDIMSNGQAGFMEGLLTATGRNTVAGTDWDVAGDPYDDIRKAIAALQVDNFYGPYQVVVSPTQASNMRKLRGTSVDTTYRDKVNDLLSDEGGGSVITEAAMPDTSVIVCQGRAPRNFALHLTPDMRLFAQIDMGEWSELRYLEGMATEVKRPLSICELTGI